MAGRIAATAVGATVGRIPVAGPILGSVAAQMVNEELQKVKIFHDDGDTEKNEKAGKEDQANSTLVQESMYASAIESYEEDVDAQSIGSSSMSSENAIMDKEDHYGDDTVVSGPTWVWLTMGSCKLDPSQLPTGWFVEHQVSHASVSGEPWRVNILQVVAELSVEKPCFIC